MSCIYGIFIIRWVCNLLTKGTIMNDEEMIKLVYSLAELDEHRRKELAILLLSTTLNPLAVEQTAGFMVGIADVMTEEKS